MSKDRNHGNTKPFVRTDPSTDLGPSSVADTSSSTDPVPGTDPAVSSLQDNPVLDISSSDDQDQTVSSREAMMRGGLLRALEVMPSSECHSIHQRLAECLPFFPGAINSCKEEILADALKNLEQFIRGEG